MTDPESLQDHVTHIVLHAWLAAYLSDRPIRRRIDTTEFSARVTGQAHKLRESAIALQVALEKMRAANEKLALRMAEHKAFFAKYQAPE